MNDMERTHTAHTAREQQHGLNPVAQKVIPREKGYRGIILFEVTRNSLLKVVMFQGGIIGPGRYADGITLL